MRILTIAVLAPVLLVGGASTAATQNIQAMATQGVRATTLQGLRAFDVRTENVSADAAAAGLATTDLQTDVERQLQRAGLRVGKATGQTLYVAVTAHKSPSGEFVYFARLEVRQTATLAGRPATVTTWDTGALGVTPRPREDVRRAVKDLTDSFLNDWLSVNPNK